MSGAINLQRYYAYVVVRMKYYFAARVDALITFFFRLAFPLIMVFLWTAVYKASGSTSISGFNITQIYTYFFVVGAVTGTLLHTVCWRINWHVTQGKIYQYLAKPTSYVAAMFVERITSVAWYVVITAIPILIIATVFFGIRLDASLLLVFFVEMGLAYLISYFVGFILGCAAFYMTDASGVYNVSVYTITLLGGGLIPLSMFPQGVSNVLTALPFAFMQYVPGATISGVVPASALPGYLELAVLWTVVLFALTVFAWKKAQKQMNVVGV